MPNRFTARRAGGLILALVMAATAHAGTIFVDAAAQPGGDGQSWATAFRTFQEAIDVAAINDEVLVAQGTYKPSKRTDINNSRTANFTIEGGLTVRGGYAGTGHQDPSIRDIVSYPTIFNGDLNGDDDHTKAGNDPARNNSENCYEIINSLSDLTLDGLIFKNGAAVAPWPRSAGGAIFTHSRLELTDCTFEYNSAKDVAGAILTGQIFATRCRFKGNFSASAGGAIQLRGGDSTFQACLFLKNSANDKGGAIQIVSFSASQKFINCVFAGNTAQLKGAALWIESTSPSIINCTFNANAANSGVIYNHSVSPSISNSIFSGNSGGDISGDANSFPAVTYTNSQDWTGGGIGNISADPLFVDADGADNIIGTYDDDYRMQANSPSIDAGDNAKVPAGVITDLAGNRRFDDDPNVTNTGSGTGSIVDQGAYERVFRPLAVNDAASTHQGNNVQLSVFDNDVTLNGGTLSITGVTQGTSGTVTIQGTKVTYSPNAGFVGSDSFTYTISTGEESPDTGTVTITVTNTAPQNTDQTVSTHWGTAKSITLAGSDADNDVITFAVVAQPQHGTLSGTAPNLTYTPMGTFTGADSFTYKVNDGAADSNVATITINVTNTAPQNADQTVSTHWGTAKSITLAGSDAESDVITFAVVAQPQHGTLSGTAPDLTYTPTGTFTGADSFTYKVNDGVADSNVATIIIDVANTVPLATDQTVSTHWGTAKTVRLTGGDADNDALTFTIVAQPQHGTLSGTAPDLTYTPTGTFTGSDSFTFTVNDGVADSLPATVTINVTNNAPTVLSAASPTSATPLEPITFTSLGTDADGDTLTYLWDFGDGGTSTDPNATHAYAAVGSYTAMVTVSDAAGGTASATVLVQVSKAPTGRVTTSDVVAFGNLPFTFDASTSTDPENAIVSYVWNFGDGSPNGSGQVISKIYEQPGTYTVTLTITDAAGVSTTISRVVEVLPANQAGLFNGFINYKVGWDRTADNKDNFSLNASVNVGDDVVGKDTTLAVEVAGQRFTGKLDQKLRDFTNADAKWTVKANVRKQPAGTVVVTLKVKKASLGLGFNQLGVTAHGDPSDIVEKDIPVRLEIGTRSFEVLVPSEFKFNAAGQKARGEGDS